MSLIRKVHLTNKVSRCDYERMQPPQTSSKILFVDDEKSILSGFKLTVGRKFNVSLASSGAEALEVFNKEGPFAVIVADFVMPRMSGAEFLKEIRKLDQEVVAMILTGAANFEVAADAVRTGGIFRLLSKPCSGTEMKENLEEALRHYQTLRAEKDMLALTMNGAMRAMTSILAAAKPLFFGRSQRVKRMAFELAKELKLMDQWRLELASTFSFLGYLTLPDEIQEKIYRNEDLPEEIDRIVQNFPDFSEGILSGIPRLEEVIRIIRKIDLDYEEPKVLDNDLTKSASVIRLAKHYDQLASEGLARPMIFERLLKNRGMYLPGGMEALSKIRNYADGGPQVQSIDLTALKQGMRIQEDLRLNNGSLVAPKGSIVNNHFISILQNYRTSYPSDPLPPKIDVIMGSSFAVDKNS